MPKNILERLKTKCPFPDVFQDMEKPEGSFISVPRRKIGHIRADHNGHRWWNTVWISHSELITPAVAAEMDQLYDALTDSDALADFETLVHLQRLTGAVPAVQRRVFGIRCGTTGMDPACRSFSRCCWRAMLKLRKESK